MSLTNKVIIVTGASSGIGAATAILFAKEGANVTIVGRNVAKLKKVSEQACKVGKPPLMITADVGNDTEAKKIIDETIKKFGKLDVLVNNAGLARYGTIKDGTVVESYDGIFNVNVRAVFLLTTLAAPHLMKTKGNIVNVSSVLGVRIRTDKKFLAYSVSKAAVDHFTKGAAAELAENGVRVNFVNPGPVKTDFLENSGLNISAEAMENFKDMTGLNRVSEPEEVADLIMFLASDKAKAITGSVILCENGILLK